MARSAQKQIQSVVRPWRGFHLIQSLVQISFIPLLAVLGHYQISKLRKLWPNPILTDWLRSPELSVKLVRPALGL